MNSFGIETVAGHISYVGDFTSDRITHNYSVIEIETAAGLVELKNALAPSDFDRVIEPGRDVAMAVIRGDGKKVKAVIVGVFDVQAQRTLSDPQMLSMRSMAARQATVLSVTAIVWLPVAFLLFVIPGLLGVALLWKAWAAVGRLPTADEVQRAITALPAHGVQLGSLSTAP